LARVGLRGFVRWSENVCLGAGLDGEYVKDRRAIGSMAEGCETEDLRGVAAMVGFVLARETTELRRGWVRLGNAGRAVGFVWEHPGAAGSPSGWVRFGKSGGGVVGFVLDHESLMKPVLSRPPILPIFP
jgi:hypothetical protein